MTKDEALQMCLEYIETNAHERRCVRWAIKDALAQPVQPEQDFKTATKEDAPLVKWAKDQTPPLPVQERNFCPRCGKRTADLTTIHTCTPPPREW